MTIRPAQQKDINAMLAIYTPYVEQTNISFEYTAPTLENFTARVEAFASEGMPWLVCVESDTVIGYAYAHRYGERQAYDWTAAASIYLAPSAKRKGVGKALYSALFALLTAQGYCSIYAMITSENEESKAFHTAVGFELLATLDHLGYKNGRWLSVSYMRKTLAPYKNVTHGAPCTMYALTDETIKQICKKAERLCKQKD